MGVLVEGINSVIALEEQHGGTVEGDQMIEGIKEEVISLFPFPIVVDILGVIQIDVDETLFRQKVDAIHGHIKTYARPSQ